MKIPASKEKRIDLELCVMGWKIELVPGALPYLWIGNNTCLGVVPDKSVKALRDMCNEILDRRELESVRKHK